eukprot:15461173-Alexandrium_andersonii.AAC.1
MAVPLHEKSCRRTRQRHFLRGEEAQEATQIGHCLTCTDKRKPSAATPLQQFAAVCCAASPGGYRHPGPP